MTGAIAIAVIVCCWSTASVLALRSTHEGPDRSLSESQRRSIGRAFSKREQRMRGSARRNFPGDHWSQDDDFHNMEQRWARGVAARNGVSLGDVLRAIDDDLREHGPGEPVRQSGARPCKPRPFYD